MGNIIGGALNGVMMYGVARGQRALGGDATGILATAAGCYGSYTIAAVMQNLVFGVGSDSKHRLFQYGWGDGGSGAEQSVKNALMGGFVNAGLLMLASVLGTQGTFGYGVDVIYYGAGYWFARSGDAGAVERKSEKMMYGSQGY